MSFNDMKTQNKAPKLLQNFQINSAIYLADGQACHAILLARERPNAQ